MKRTENVSLASLTTFKMGGIARTVFDCSTVEEIQIALAYARESDLPWYVLGGGSNVLASDDGYDGVIILPHVGGITFENRGREKSEEHENDTDEVLVTAGAGVTWDVLVEETMMSGLWGLENLAGIPGTVGAAPVQNVGAYGADISGTLLHCDVLDTTATDSASAVIRMTNAECAFGYRDSIFKKFIDTSGAKYIILRASFLLTKKGTPRTEYADFVACRAAGITLDTPENIADAVRSIRAQKFPDLSTNGTAGSFFKNPSIEKNDYDALKQKFPDLPGYPSETDPNLIKVSLAWILDHVLHLRGFSNGLAHVRLFERQPLVLVSEKGATAVDVDALATEVSKRVFNSTGIIIEREVRSL